MVPHSEDVCHAQFKIWYAIKKKKSTQLQDTDMRLQRSVEVKCVISTTLAPPNLFVWVAQLSHNNNKEFGVGLFVWTEGLRFVWLILAINPCW